MKKESIGMIHLYEGDGKGKTTAAIGLAIRFAGNGGRVIFTQFLKDNTSKELTVLEQIPQIHLIRCDKTFGFTFHMIPEEKKEAGDYYSEHLKNVLETAKREQVGLLVLDEIAVAYSKNMIEREVLLSFLKNKPDDMEVVLTGREPREELRECADYITYMEKRKHPYDQGIGARRGIEL